MSVSQMRKERLRRVRSVAQGHTGLQEIRNLSAPFVPSPFIACSQLLYGGLNPSVLEAR